MKHNHETQLVLRILARIQEHTYKDPIRITTLAAEFQVDERKVKACVEELRSAGHKVGSRKEKPYGLFIAVDPIEINDTASRLEKEGINLLKRARQLRDFGSAAPTIFEQMVQVPETEHEDAIHHH